MKKTLITLAALAVASVAQAVVVDFTTPGSLTETVSFAGDSTDVITLAGATTIMDNVITDTASGTSVTNTNVSKNVNGILFNHASATDSGLLHGATINFGVSGSLTLDLTHQANLAPYNRDVNLYGQEFTFNISLDFIQETDDADLAGTTAIVTRNLMYGVPGLWNNTGSNNAYTVNVSSYNDASLTLSNQTNEAANDRIAKDLATSDGVGAWQIYTPDGNNIEIAYVVQYVAATPDTPAVPEPTTATLSLFALAGLAARRRRK